MGLESFGKKLAQLGQDTRSSVQKMGENYQLNSKIADEKKGLEKLFQTIGEAIFEADPENAPAGLEEEFEAVKAAKAAIAELESQKQKTKGVVICPD